MFCLYCNETLELINDELYCRSGNCYYSKHLTDKFTSSLTMDKSKSEKVISISSTILGKFFCVNCGKRMNKVKEIYEKCNNCGFEIDKRTYFEILELSPHNKNA